MLKSKAVENQYRTKFLWENATVYFLLTDRFSNGNRSNDTSLDRERDGGLLRSFEGGDFRGIINKIDEGYFDSLGITALWFTPPFEQVRGATDEGTGRTYAYHGYWPRDWTVVDPNYGTEKDFKELVEKAHQHGIRILMDVVINHTGPVTNQDGQWPEDWVRVGPACTYNSYESTVSCTLVENLPDIKTESNDNVELPVFLVEKWKKEGRYEQEVKELDEFFKRTGHPRAPRFYIIKWLVDYIKKFGIDGFRVDTVKHVEDYVWEELYEEAVKAFNQWKKENPASVLDDNDFYMVGEVYGYSIYHGKNFPMDGGEKVDFYKRGFKGLINFSFKADAGGNPEEVFSKYSDILNHGELKENSVLNYISSHDDDEPFDGLRGKSIQAGTRLLLAPGAAQVYYGDELGRLLHVPGAVGDANLRSNMNWEDLYNNRAKNGVATTEILSHWRKLGRFRKEHPSVGAGIHEKISDQPYTFKRTIDHHGILDKVLVVMENESNVVDVAGVFEEGTVLKEYYLETNAVVKQGKVTLSESGPLVLLGISETDK